MLTFTQYLLNNRLDVARRRLALEMARQNVDPYRLLLTENNLITEGLFSAIGRAWKAFWNTAYKPTSPQDYAQELANKAGEYDNLLQSYLQVVQQQSGDGSNVEPILQHVEQLYQQVKGGMDQVGQSIEQINADPQAFVSQDQNVQQLRNNWKALSQEVLGIISNAESEADKEAMLGAYQKLRQFFAQVSEMANNNQNAALQKEAQTILNSLRSPEFIWVVNLMKKFQPQAPQEQPQYDDDNEGDDTVNSGEFSGNQAFELPRTVQTIEQLAAHVKTIKDRPTANSMINIWAKRNGKPIPEVWQQVKQINDGEQSET